MTVHHDQPPCDSFDQAVEELRLAIYGMKPGEYVSNVRIGQFADHDRMDKKSRGKFYWSITFETHRRVGVNTGERTPPGHDEQRLREAVRQVEGAITEAREALRERMRSA